jgi:hypothetical protein
MTALQAPSSCAFERFQKHCIYLRAQRWFPGLQRKQNSSKYGIGRARFSTILTKELSEHSHQLQRVPTSLAFSFSWSNVLYVRCTAILDAHGRVVAVGWTIAAMASSRSREVQ